MSAIDPRFIRLMDEPAAAPQAEDSGRMPKQLAESLIRPGAIDDLQAIARVDLPPRVWIVEDVIGEQEVAVWFGLPESGKSSVANHLGAAAAAGRPSVFGLAIPKAVPVLIVDAEQGKILGLRMLLKACAGVCGYDETATTQSGAPVTNVPPGLWRRGGEDVDLSTPEGVEQLEAAIAFLGPKLVILDSITVVFGQGNTFEAKDVASIYSKLFALRDRYECSFLLIGHANKSDGEASLRTLYGSTAHASSVDSAIHVSLDPETSTIRLRTVKMRDGRRIHINLEMVGSDASLGYAVLAPQGSARSRAKQAMVEELELVGGVSLSRKRLLEVATEAGDDISADTADRAHKELSKAGRIKSVGRSEWVLGNGSHE